MTVIAYLGNHGPSHSTESHVAASMESLGHRVIRIQEGDTPATSIAGIVKEQAADVFFWTQTYGLAVSGGTIHERYEMLEDIKSLGVPTIAFHLDLWWGLDREPQLREEPYFRCDHVFTTDNCRDRWAELGVNHHYLSPGVYHAEAIDTYPQPEYVSDIAFVGSVNYGHREHSFIRRQMLKQVQRKYQSRVQLWPKPGHGAVRGMALTHLYASVKVVVGDSCLAGKIPGYFSDRVPETTGRGGFLIHPYVPGILDEHPNLVTYEPGNWTQLLEKIDYYLHNESDRELTRRQCAEWTRTHHTYRHKVEAVLAVIGKGNDGRTDASMDQGSDSVGTPTSR